MNASIRIGLALLFFALLALSRLAQSSIITTYVGPQMPVNGRQATTQSIDGPSSVASDGAGGFSGDGGPATSAQLYSPRGVAVDTAGNRFISQDDDTTFKQQL